MGLSIDAIILDYHMPVMNGLDVVERIRADRRFDDIAIISLRAPGGRRIDAPAGPLKAIVGTMVDLLTDPARNQRKDGDPLRLGAWEMRRIEALRAIERSFARPNTPAAPASAPNGLPMNSSSAPAVTEPPFLDAFVDPCFPDFSAPTSTDLINPAALHTTSAAAASSPAWR